jgi:hypothetical protein
MPSLKRNDRKQGGTNCHAMMPEASKRFYVSLTGMLGTKPTNLPFLQPLLTLAPLSAAAKSDAACRYLSKSKTTTSISGAGVIVPSTPSPVRMGRSSTVSTISSSSNRQQQAVHEGFHRLSELFGPSTPGFMLPTASSRARSLTGPNRFSTHHISMVSTPARGDRVCKVVDMAPSTRLPNLSERVAKVSARQPLQDSSSKMAQQDLLKLRMGRDKLQAQLRQLQEQHQAEAQVSQERVARVLVSLCSAYWACKLLALCRFALCLECAFLMC